MGIDNTGNETILGLLTVNGMKIYSNTANTSSGIRELFRVANDALCTSGYFTISATGNGFVHTSQWIWSTTHNGGNGRGVLTQLSGGEYSNITLYLDVTTAGSAIISADWGASYGYSIQLIKTQGTLSYAYQNTDWSTVASGYYRLRTVGSYSLAFQLSTDTAYKPSTNTWTITSDMRVKENIIPYDKGLSIILAINPITFNYNGKGGFDKSTGGIGVIAQDMIDILPESVTTFNAKLNDEDVSMTELYNFNSHSLTYVLINAIKEQQILINSLQLQIDELKKQ